MARNVLSSIYCTSHGLNVCFRQIILYQTQPTVHIDRYQNCTMWTPFYFSIYSGHQTFVQRTNVKRKQVTEDKICVRFFVPSKMGSVFSFGKLSCYNVHLTEGVMFLWRSSVLNQRRKWPLLKRNSHLGMAQRCDLAINCWIS